VADTVRISKSGSKATEELAAANAQRSEARNRATFDMLVKKRHLEREVPIKIPGDDGELTEVTMLFRAIGARDYDRLMTKHPPTTEQRAEGSNYNIHTFGPALIARVCVDPEISEQDTLQIWNSSDWNRGEVMSLFTAAVEICNKGLDIPFTGLG
jgi:hypothetical protein